MYLDDVPLPEVEHQHLHSQIGIVSQEPVLFAASIFYNISFGLRRGEADATLAQAPPLVLRSSD